MKRLCAVVLACAAIPAVAEAAPARTTLPEIEQQVMCVTCGVPLAIAESPQADREREFIRGLIARGETPAQIKAALVAQFGSNVLALPHANGFALWVYVVPIAALAVVLAALALTLPRWRRRRDYGEALEADLSAADAARLSDDLRRYPA